MRIIKIKNNQALEDIYCGNIIGPNEYYTITSEQERMAFAENEKVNQDLWSEPAKIIINDGISDLENKVEGENWLKGNISTKVTLTGDNVTKIQKAQRVSIYPTEGSSTTLVSHDFTNKCTWYSNSIQIIDEILSDSGDQQTYNSLNQYWINLTDGLITDEDLISDNYPIIIKKNDIEIDKNDYSINYENGSITFNNPMLVTDTIKATYNYANGSEWILKPDTNQIYRIKHTEIQFTKDVIINTSVYFEIWVYDPNNYPNKILYTREVFKNARDYVNFGNEGKGCIPAFGGSSRGLQNDILVFPFNYASAKDLKNSVGAELRIKLENDIPHTGEFATVALYIFIEEEE